MSSTSDGFGESAGIFRPNGIAFHEKNNSLIISQMDSHLIRTVGTDGYVQTYAGTDSGFQNGYRYIDFGNA